MIHQNSRTARVMGPEALETLAQKHVAIFGVGGVGGITVGRPTLVWDATPRTAMSTAPGCTVSRQLTSTARSSFRTMCPVSATSTVGRCPSSP